VEEDESAVTDAGGSATGVSEGVAACPAMVGASPAPLAVVRAGKGGGVELDTPGAWAGDGVSLAAPRLSPL
jgi:hypothetical protein